MARVAAATVSTRNRRGPDAADVLARVRLVALVDELGGRLRRSGATFRGPCIVHGGDNPTSLVVTPGAGDDGRDLWVCHACGAGGDAWDLVAAVEGGDRARALDRLARWAGVEVDRGPGAPRRAPLAAPRTPRRDPVPDSPPDARVRVMGALWAILEDGPMSTGADRYLTGRGIDPSVPYSLGCRDWWGMRASVLDLVNATSPADLVAAGLAVEDPAREHGIRLWWPLAEMYRGDATKAGLGVPVWLPGDPAPLGWRWRWYRVPDKAAKAWAQPAPGAGWSPPMVLGLGRPSCAGEWPLMPGAGKAPVVLIAEGEPDWWALSEVAGSRAVVVSVAGGSSRWDDDWTRALVCGPVVPDLVAVVSHGGRRDAAGVNHGAVLAEAVAVSLVRVMGRDAAAQRFCRWLLSESDDANDKHKRGDLAPWLEGVLQWRP